VRANSAIWPEISIKCTKNPISAAVAREDAEGALACGKQRSKSADAQGRRGDMRAMGCECTDNGERAGICGECAAICGELTGSGGDRRWDGRPSGICIAVLYGVR
jgi:hypothetical protein